MHSYEMHNKTEKIKDNATLAGFCIAIAAVVSIVMYALYKHEMNVGIEELLRHSLATQKDVSSDVLWTRIDVKFRSGEYENVATTDSWGTRARIDVNKSKVIGEWVGEKSKEAAGGVFRGILKPSKHKDN